MAALSVFKGRFICYEYFCGLRRLFRLVFCMPEKFSRNDFLSHEKGDVKKAQTAKKRTCRTKADIKGQENKTVSSQAFSFLKLYAFLL